MDGRRKLTESRQYRCVSSRRDIYLTYCAAFLRSLGLVGVLLGVYLSL